MNRQIIEGIVAKVSFPDFQFHIEQIDSVIYLQVCHTGACNVTGEQMAWKGRKWMLSRHMVPGEIVQTCFKALVTAIEHEAREQFKYKGVAVFGPHFNIDRLVTLASDANAIQERTPA